MVSLAPFYRRCAYGTRLHSSTRLWVDNEIGIFRQQVASLTVVVALEHLHFLLIIWATEKLTLLDDVLIAFLQLHPANHLHDDDINQGDTRTTDLNTHADKAFNVEHVVDSPHNQLVTSNLLRTTKTPVLHEQSSVFVVVGAIRRVLIVYDAAKAAAEKRWRQQHSTFEIKGKEDERRKWLWLFNILALSSHKLLRTAGGKVGGREAREGKKEENKKMFSACEELETKSDTQRLSAFLLPLLLAFVCLAMDFYVFWTTAKFPNKIIHLHVPCLFQFGRGLAEINSTSCQNLWRTEKETFVLAGSSKCQWSLA